MSLRPVGWAAVVAVSLASVLASAPAANAADEDAAPPVARVAIVMPLTVPITDPAVTYVEPDVAPVAPTLIDAPTLAYYTSPTGVLTTELEAVIDRNVTIGIDPMIIASIRALGSSVPASAAAWLDRLMSASNETFPLTWADSDMSLPLQAGSKTVIADAPLDFAIDPSLFSTATVTGAPTDPADGLPTATPADGTAPPLPTAADLTAWNYTMPAVAWPQANTVATRNLTAITRSGYGTTILSSSNVTRSVITSATAKIGSNTVLISDEKVSAQFASALVADSDSTWESAVSAVTDSIAAAAGPVDGGSVVIALDRSTAVPTGRLASTIDATASADGVDLVRLSTVRADAGASAKLVSRKHSATRIDRTEQLLDAEEKDARFATVAAKPEFITAERRLRLLVTLSPASENQTGGWTAATKAYLDESTALLQSVQLERSSDVLLLANRQSISFGATNDLDQPVTAYIEVRPLNPNLTVENSRVKVEIEPHSQRRGSVPVESVSNGKVELAVTLMTGDEVQLGKTAYVPITVRAGWEGPFTLIAGILVVLVFAFGIVRSVLRRRAARDAAAGE